MPHYGVLRDYKFQDVEDVRGAEVYGVNNEKLGTVDDVVFDHSTGEIRYVVVDTGGWLANRRVLVPLGRIEPYGAHPDRFYAELDQERIQMLPEFNQDILKSETGWANYEQGYQERWNEGAGTQPLSEEALEKMGTEDELLGVASSGDDVTLPPQKPSKAGHEDVRMQQPAESKPDAATPPPPEALQEPRVYVLDRIPEVEQKSSLNEPLNVAYGRRWIAFQQRLREGRDKVVSDCPLCGTQDKAA